MCSCWTQELLLHCTVVERDTVPITPLYSLDKNEGLTPSILYSMSVVLLIMLHFLIVPLINFRVGVSRTNTESRQCCYTLAWTTHLLYLHIIGGPWARRAAHWWPWSTANTKATADVGEKDWKNYHRWSLAIGSSFICLDKGKHSSYLP